MSQYRRVLRLKPPRFDTSSRLKDFLNPKLYVAIPLMGAVSTRATISKPSPGKHNKNTPPNAQTLPLVQKSAHPALVLPARLFTNAIRFVYHNNCVLFLLSLPSSDSIKLIPPASYFSNKPHTPTLPSQHTTSSY